MSRITVASLLALGLLPACDDVDVNSGEFGDYAGLREDQDATNEDVVGHEAPVGLTTLDSSAATPNPQPVLPIPPTMCGHDECVEGGLAQAVLSPADRARAAYFDIMGYPDEGSYTSHTAAGHPGVQAGVWGSTLRQISFINAAMLDAGVLTCDSAPRSGLEEGDLADLSFGPSEMAIPDGYKWDGGILDREVVVSGNIDDIAATIQFSCDAPVAHGEFRYAVDGVEFRTQAWWSTPWRSAAEIEIVGTADGINYGASIRSTHESMKATLVSSYFSGLDQIGTRVVLQADPETAISSGYEQVLRSGDWLYHLPEAGSREVAGAAVGSEVRCLRFDSEDALRDGVPCAELGLEQAASSSFTEGQDYTIRWISAPAGRDGMLELFED